MICRNLIYQFAILNYACCFSSGAQILDIFNVGNDASLVKQRTFEWKSKTTPCETDASPCGPNSLCIVANTTRIVCSCKADCIGKPPNCRPECTVHTECPPQRACVQRKCVDPCQGTCGIKALCRVENREPICSCPPGHTGNPLVTCNQIRSVIPLPNLCYPSLCGRNAICEMIAGCATCSCLDDYVGEPPYCRPQCSINEDCPINLSCQDKKCRDPCANFCGINARCNVLNHKPICSCPPGFSGYPLLRCEKIPTPAPDPCISLHCGPYAFCKSNGSRASCSCRGDCIGQPPNCRPQCFVNEECPTNLSCSAGKCRDPCIHQCGDQMSCVTVNHKPVCICGPGFTGNADTGCYPIRITVIPDPCLNLSCGANALCETINGTHACVCLPKHYGDPYYGCRPGCETNSDCDLSRWCLNNTCKDPCSGRCSTNAICTVENHTAYCRCSPGYDGNPYTDGCHIVRPALACTSAQSSECGPYSECRAISGHHSVCCCQKGFIGVPPSCPPKCTTNSECALDRACVNNKCIDLCPSSCCPEAYCRVINHSAVCS